MSRDEKPEAKPYQWVMTGTATKYGTPRGWRLHAVEATDQTKFSEIKHSRAACGLRSKAGWGVDLFVEKKCAKCLVKLGLACPICLGNGSTGTVGEEEDVIDWTVCYPCGGTGERRDKQA